MNFVSKVFVVSGAMLTECTMVSTSMRRAGTHARSLHIPASTLITDKSNTNCFHYGNLVTISKTSSSKKVLFQYARFLGTSDQKKDDDDEVVSKGNEDKKKFEQYFKAKETKKAPHSNKQGETVEEPRWKKRWRARRDLGASTFALAVVFPACYYQCLVEKDASALPQFGFLFTCLPIYELGVLGIMGLISRDMSLAWDAEDAENMKRIQQEGEDKNASTSSDSTTETVADTPKQK